MINSLYVHIPFCSSICSYCDFCKLIYNDKFAFSYIEQLKKEIVNYKQKKFDTIYIGGGTPSCLSDDLFKSLLEFLQPMLKFNGEFTIEVNPESLNEEKAKIMKFCGINRVSIGLQTTSSEYLKLLNRPPLNVFVSSFQLLRKYGFNNINVDLMYALPNETLSQVKNDLDFLLSLRPEHISTYSLILEENSIFGKKGIKEEDSDVQATQYEYILKTLRKAGYDRYEVSNFCLNDKKSRHNLTYWNDEEYIGCGLGASGYINNKRYTNTKSLPLYLKGNYIDFEEEVTGEDIEKYYLLTKLRLEEGFLLSEYEEKIGTSFIEKHNSEYKKLLKDCLLVNEQGRIKATDKGILLLDRILLNLF